MIYMVVGIAGVFGALSRYGIGLAVANVWGLSSIAATLPINLAGSLLLGWFFTYAGIAGTIPPWFRAGFGTGFIGAFTTFSTFSMETVLLIEHGLWLKAGLYIFSSLWGGLLAAWAGQSAAQAMGRGAKRK